MHLGDRCIRCLWGTFDLLVQLTQTVRKPKYLMGEDILKTHLGCPSSPNAVPLFKIFNIQQKPQDFLGNTSVYESLNKIVF